jgi:hypothetical protein
MKTGKREQERRQARNQLTALGLIVSAVLAAAIWARQAPADAAELRILVGELRSQAAELEIVGQEAAAGRLGQPFVREHGKQLAKINLSSFRELARLRVEQDLEVEKRDAVAAGRELVTQIGALATGQRPAPPSELQRIREGLQNRERALRR